MKDTLEGPFGESAGGQGLDALVLLLGVLLLAFILKVVAERYYSWHDQRHPWPGSLEDEDEKISTG